MANQVYFLNEKDRNLLRDAVKRVNNRPLNTTGRSTAVPDTPGLDTNATPEVYVALTIDSGLYALAKVDALDPVPTDVTGGYVQVYQVNYTDGILVPVPEFKPFVYNLSTNDIPPDTWVLIQRDKFGSWYAIDVETGESDAGTSTAADCEQYTVSCQNGWLIRYRCVNGEYIYDSNTGVPCPPRYSPTETGTGTSTGSGTDGESPYLPYDYPLLFDVVTNVCLGPLNPLTLVGRAEGVGGFQEITPDPTSLYIDAEGVLRLIGEGDTGTGSCCVDGEDGATWDDGNGPPSDLMGNDGDYYLDGDNGDVYKKIAGTYTVVANIDGTDGVDGVDGDDGLRGRTGTAGPRGYRGRTGTGGPIGLTGLMGARGRTGTAGPYGPAGADGKTLRYGSGVPSAGLGVDGDFYLDNSAYKIYGPKASGAWPTGVNIRGKTGTGGPPGPTGATGGTGPAPSGTGIVCVSSGVLTTARTLTAPAAGFTITNPTGGAGDPTFVLADDLAGLEAMSSTGLVSRTTSNTYAQRTLTSGSNRIAVANGDGASGNPTVTLTEANVILSNLGGTLTATQIDMFNTLTHVTGVALDDALPFEDISAIANAYCTPADLRVLIGVPTGTVAAFGVSTIPTGWLECDGSSLLRATYPDLYALLGSTWGAPADGTHFYVPDFRGRTLIGAGLGAGLTTTRTFAAAGGAETVTLVANDIPAHKHRAGWRQEVGLVAGNLNFTLGGANTWAVDSASVGATTATGGSDGLTANNTTTTTSHANMQPYQVTKWMIKT